MSRISTHVLDTALGTPADQVAVQLSRREGERWLPVSQGETNRDGRVVDLAAAESLVAGHYRLDFSVEEYFARRGQTTFFPEIQITFHVVDPSQNHHVPLLLSPFGYSTYRGS
jgi:5-hydroxyisourate hydrolase